MSPIFITILLLMVGIYAAIFIFFKQKKKKLKDSFLATDFSQEVIQADNYKNKLLHQDLRFINEQMDHQPIDALIYANPSYSNKDQTKDMLKDSLKGMATLGTVRFTTVQTPKYLILSGKELHLLDTDTNGDISNHFVFDENRLQDATIQSLPLKGMNKSYANFSGVDLLSYSINLPADEGNIILEIHNTLLFTSSINQGNFLTNNTRKTMEDYIIANQFLYKLGKLYPNLQVNVTLPFKY